MSKRVQIEVFKDEASSWLDSDDIAHALATIEALKPFVEIINRQRQLILPESHQPGILDIDDRLRVVLSTNAAMFYTDRTIVGESLVALGQISGVYLPDSKVAVVSANSINTTRTARHEVGHALYDSMGIVSATGEDVSDHCSIESCVMYEAIISDKRIQPADMRRRLLEEFGIRAFQYTDATVPIEYCSSCEAAIARSAEIRMITDDNPSLADIIYHAASR